MICIFIVFGIDSKGNGQTYGAVRTIFRFGRSEGLDRFKLMDLPGHKVISKQTHSKVNRLQEIQSYYVYHFDEVLVSAAEILLYPPPPTDHTISYAYAWIIAVHFM